MLSRGVVLLSRGVVMVSWSVSLDLRVSGSVSCFCVLYFWGFDWDTLVDHWDVDWTVPFLNRNVMGPMSSVRSGSRNSVMS